ncbi:MAG: hypothetical protein IKE77_10505, partial [Erysipelotrichaceae bacterium]|nr:hypothetical protein [Erysipelotrichaceae bacterium]
MDKKETNGIAASRNTINLDMFTGASEDIYGDLNIDEEDELEAQYNQLKQNADKGNVLWGIVFGVDVDTTSSFVIITVYWNNTRILIHEDEYFEKTFNFGNDFEYLSVMKKLDKKVRAGRYNIGSKCPFIISEVGKLPITSGYYSGEEEIVAIASRRQALAKIRDKYFIHKYSDNPVTVPVNAKAKANVLYVCENYVTVECLGVETRIDAYNLNESYV